MKTLNTEHCLEVVKKISVVKNIFLFIMLASFIVMTLMFLLWSQQKQPLIFNGEFFLFFLVSFLLSCLTGYLDNKEYNSLIKLYRTIEKDLPYEVDRKVRFYFKERDISKLKKEINNWLNS
ncbi:hypothetical protein HLB25_21415 [Dickeya dadantii]|uniref:hypothetical protein n=1 Tax=Dickeya dadantii TaxID=204038 RepID=UPI0014956561|nr:hypothetical protein [Dickeya dadantii]NPE56595.1 hypothetical protein [Dickeya dadantii]NPE69068.1 hypothetical protein [Dickeya dadantii]